MKVTLTICGELSFEAKREIVDNVKRDLHAGMLNAMKDNGIGNFSTRDLTVKEDKGYAIH